MPIQQIASPGSGEWSLNNNRALGLAISQDRQNAHTSPHSPPGGFIRRRRLNLGPLEQGGLNLEQSISKAKLAIRTTRMIASVCMGGGVIGLIALAIFYNNLPRNRVLRDVLIAVPVVSTLFVAAATKLFYETWTTRREINRLSNQ